MSFLKRWLPILSWLPNYQKKHLSGDLAAGLTVGIILIPQGMAYANIAQIPPVYGLYAATIPILLYAIFGTAPQLAIGATATASIMTMTGISELGLASPYTENFAQVAILLALLVGVIQFMMGLFKLGFLVNFMSNPVISGFTSAAAFIIILSQIKHIVGIQIENSSYFHLVILAVFQKFQDINWISVTIGLSGIFIILFLKRLKSKIPGTLIATILSILVVWLANLDQVGVAITGTIPSGLPQPTIPMWDANMASLLLGSAFAIALVGFLESSAISKTLQNKHKDHKVDANQELIALGISKIGGVFFQAYPTTGGFSRTAVNDQVGAKTPLAGIVSSIIVVLTLLFLTPLFYYMPNAILASIIIASVLKLIDYKTAIKLWIEDRVDFYMLLSTFLGTIFLGIQQGILVGVLLSIIVLIYRSAYPHIAFLGQLTQTADYRNLNRFEQIQPRKDMLIMRIDAPLYFANSPYIEEVIEEKFEQYSTIKLFVLHAETIAFVDSTGIQCLSKIKENLEKKGILFYLSGVTGPVRDKLYRTGLIHKLGKDALFLSIKDAVAYYDHQIDAIETAERNAYANQYNRKKRQKKRG